MSGHAVHRDARRDLAVFPVECYPLLEQTMHEFRDMLRRVGAAFAVVEHPAPGGELHLGFLDMEPRARKVPERPGVVVVQMGDDHVLDA